MRIRTLMIFCGLLGLWVALAPVSAVAQQTEKRSEIELLPVSPPPELPVRPWGPYTLSVGLEFGGQIADVSGNHEVWESQQNYRDGFRVFGFSLRGKATDSKALFTDFYAEGGGWGNEPYSWVRFGLSRDKWFDFRGNYRESEYNWFFPNFARSQHLNDTKRRLQDYTLTFFPKQKFRLKLGYKRNSSFGPTLTTLDFSRGEFPVFEPLRQTYDEYTIGGEVNIQKWLIVGEYGYRFFRNDRFVSLFENDARALLICGAATCPNDPADAARLFEWERLYPSRGKIPFASLNIVGRPHRTLEANARLVYSWGKSDFTRSEFFDGRTFSQGGANPSTTITMDQEAFGESKRPMTTLNGNLTWRPWHELTVTNNFEFYGYDIAGFSDEARDIGCGNGTVAGCPLEATPAIPGDPLSGEQRLFKSILFDLDTFRNRTELRYDFTDWLGVRGGFNYVHRTFQHVMFEQFFEDGSLEDEEFEDEGFDYINRSWLFGAELRFHRKAQFFFDGEVGDNTRVFTRTGPANLDRYRLRGKFEPWNGIRFNASWFIFDNQNFDLPIPNADFVNGVVTTPETIAGRHSARNRGFSADFQLARFERAYFDIGYSRNDVTTITDVAFYVASRALANGVSLYVLNDNYFYFDVGGRLVGKLYGEAGYRLVDSSGSFPPSDPPDACEPFLVRSCTNLTTLDPIGFFDGGLRYHMPNASVRYSFSDNVSWKAGWRYYRYNQQGGAFSDYKAHVLTTSIVLNF